MKVYSDSETPQNVSTLLDDAEREGGVVIRRKNGRTFMVVPEGTVTSPLDVEGVDLGLTTDEIVTFIHEGRRGS